MPIDPMRLSAPERNRYFYGLMMDAERFQQDQDYFNHKRWLLNRFVTGAGVVCGLGLTFDQAKKTVMLSPGMAIDAAGREIIVPSATPVDTSRLTDAHGKPVGSAPPGSTLLISLVYTEWKIDPVPVLVPDCDNPGDCAPSTIEEAFRVLVTLAGPPPAIPGCALGSFPLPPGVGLQSAIAGQVAAGCGAGGADPSVALGRFTLPTGPLDSVSDRPVVYDNTLLYRLIVCLAQQVSEIAGTLLSYVSGDNQSAGPGAALAMPLVIALVDANGNPVTGGSEPTFTVDSGGGSVGAVTASGPGQYQTTWALGSSGTQSVTAQCAQSKLTVPFKATIKP